jgi:hypothetical protein
VGPGCEGDGVDGARQGVGITVGVNPDRVGDPADVGFKSVRHVVRQAVTTYGRRPQPTGQSIGAKGLLLTLQ